MEPIRIKICGLTRLEDAVAALEAGADYLGFNFHPKSPRHVAPPAARRILEGLKERGYRDVKGVGVFVDHPIGEIRRILDETGLRIAQFHGSESPDDIAALEGFERIKAVKVHGPGVMGEMARYPSEAILADAPHPTLAGGSGLSYDYSLVADAARRFKLFLAGGLTPDNVAAAARLVRPFAVDSASGVESSPGVKDAGKIAAFCAAVKAL